MNESQAFLENLPFWNHLTDLEKQAVEESAFVKTLPAGSMLEGLGDGCQGMVHILSGELRVYMLSEEGREISLYRLPEGETCVLSAACVISTISFETHMEAVEETKVIILPSVVFDDLTERNIYARCFLYELASRRFTTVMWVMQQILFARFDQRLATFLLAEYRRTGSAELHMTQEQIAEGVNSAREVVARMLKQFAADGYLESGRGVIRILRPEALRQLEI